MLIKLHSYATPSGGSKLILRVKWFFSLRDVSNDSYLRRNMIVAISWKKIETELSSLKLGSRLTSPAKI